MDRAQKKEWIDAVHQNFSGAQVILVGHNTGLSVPEMNDLRARVRKAGAGFKVTKNRLAKLALKETNYEGLSDMFKGPTMVAFSSDPVSVAKALAEFAKVNEKFVLLGGAFGAHRLDKAGINQLASLPSLDELRAKILAMLNTPAQRLATLMQAPAGQLARVTSAYSKKEAN